MGKIVGIRFNSAGKIYDFDAGAFVLTQGDHVILETKQGLGYGVVAIVPENRNEKKNKRPLKKVFRMATSNDKDQLIKNEKTKNFSHSYCQHCINKLGLKMNLFSVETTFDAKKTTFFFTAQGRVDFRQLVKMLVKKLRVRVEMRQVGIRNQAKMIGGIGRCGREICCGTFIEKFEPVSIRMAKAQGLSLNPTKISGLCGRLMCCLTFENTESRNKGKGTEKRNRNRSRGNREKSNAPAKNRKKANPPKRKNTGKS
jgi:cell fate regulator YaaT (PSP1 superfamily)